MDRIYGEIRATGWYSIQQGTYVPVIMGAGISLFIMPFSV